MFCVAGIGIDDMFVIVQCINNLKREADSGKWSLAERLGHGLRHAGVSITVTSATDVVAFAVGAVTVSSSTVHWAQNQYKTGFLCIYQLLVIPTIYLRPFN